MSESSPYYTNETSNDNNAPVKEGTRESTDYATLIIYGILIIAILYVIFNAYGSFCANQEDGNEGFLGGIFRSDLGADNYVESAIKDLDKRQSALLGN